MNVYAMLLLVCRLASATYDGVFWVDARNTASFYFCLGVFLQISCVCLLVTQISIGMGV